MKKTLLLDFDGVIIRDRKILQYQTEQSVKFLQKKTNIHYQSALEINKKLYPQLGHTVNVIEKVFNQNVSLQEYNNFVFDNDKMQEQLSECFNAKVIDYMNEFINVLVYCETKNISYNIFTNAPYEWVQFVLSYSNLRHFFNKKNVFYPKSKSTLKPNILPYTKIRIKYPENQLILVDDQYKNIDTIKNNIQWKGVLYQEHNTPFDINIVLEEN